MNRKIRLILQPFWQYVNQPVSDTKSVWNLTHFWHLYKVQLLHKCWNQQFSEKSNPYY